MKFKEYLTASSKIKELCQPFLRESHGEPMYRGASGALRAWLPVKVEDVIKDRQPRDSSKFIHQLMDDWFFKHYDQRPRSQAAFCIGNKIRARDYGTLCYAFPVGDFKFIWGEEAQGGIPDTVGIGRMIKDRCAIAPAGQATMIADDVLTGFTWHTDGLARAIELGAEIAISCDQIILVPAKFIQDYRPFYEELVK